MNTTNYQGLSEDEQVILGYNSGHHWVTKFGRNPDVDIGTVPQDMFNGSGLYTGMNAVANENLTLAAAAADVGTLVTSGTITGVSGTTVTDTSATFVTDSVAVGDLLIDDTRGVHGVISVVVGEQRLKVHQWVDGIVVVGSDYRIATAGSTGAAVAKCSQILNSNFEPQTSVYVILNGTTAVTTTGVDAFRCSRAQVIIAGSSGTNAGVVTVTQAVTTANAFAQIPIGTGQTTVMAYTVAKNKTAILKRVRAAITRANGSAGSATIVLNVRRRGEAWRAIRVFECATQSPTEFSALGGDVLLACTDIKMTVTFVSDANTIAEGAIEMKVLG